MVSSLGKFFSTSIVKLSVYDVFVLLIFVVALILTIIFSLIIIATKVRRLNSDFNDHSNAQIASNKAILDNLDVVVSHLEHQDHVGSSHSQPTKRVAHESNYRNSAMDEDEKSLNIEEQEYLDSNEEKERVKSEDYSDENEIEKEDNHRKQGKKDINNKKHHEPEQEIVINTEHPVIDQAEILPKPINYKLPSMALNIINDNEKLDNNHQNANEQPRQIPTTKNVSSNQEPLVVTSSLPQLPNSTNPQYLPNLEQQRNNFNPNSHMPQRSMSRPFDEIQLPSLNNYNNSSANMANFGGNSAKERIEQMRAKLNSQGSPLTSSSSSAQNIARLREKLNANSSIVKRTPMQLGREGLGMQRNNLENGSSSRVLPAFNMAKGKRTMAAPAFRNRLPNMLSSDNTGTNNNNFPSLLRNSPASNKNVSPFRNKLSSTNRTSQYLSNREEQGLPNNTRPVLRRSNSTARPSVIANIKRPNLTERNTLSRNRTLASSATRNDNSSIRTPLRNRELNRDNIGLRQTNNNFVNRRNVSPSREQENNSPRTLSRRNTVSSSRANITNNDTRSNNSISERTNLRRDNRKNNDTSARSNSRGTRNTNNRSNMENNTTTNRGQRNNRSSRRAVR